MDDPPYQLMLPLRIRPRSRVKKPMGCVVDGCKEVHHARGLCATHYGRKFNAVRRKAEREQLQQQRATRDQPINPYHRQSKDNPDVFQQRYERSVQAETQEIRDRFIQAEVRRRESIEASRIEGDALRAKVLELTMD